MASILSSVYVAPQEKAVKRLPRRKPVVKAPVVPVTQRTPGRRDEVRNDAGHYVFQVSDKDRLERFLILGTESGRYGVDRAEFTAKNANFLVSLIKKNVTSERMVLDTAVAISEAGRAYSNTPAIFAVAAAMVFGQDKAASKAAVTRVCRTSTHIFEYAQFIENLGGWGRAKRESVANWFTSQDTGALAYQSVKYRQRNGWTLRDLMRLSHPKGVDPAVGNFILSKGSTLATGGIEIIEGFREMQKVKTEADVLRVLATYKNLPWETIPTDFLKSDKVWKALFYNGQLKGQAQVRNITRLARIGAFSDSAFTRDFAAGLTDEKMLERSRLHPVNLLNAAVVYSEGQVNRDGYGGWAFSVHRKPRTWTTNRTIAAAIDEAFHKSFKFVEPAGKRTLLAVDISGSMRGPVLGLDLSAAQVSAAMAMTIARTEPWHEVRGFSTQFIDLGISATDSLASAMNKVSGKNFGATNCSLPMTWAKSEGVEVDHFVVVTDNDTNSSRIKPADALRQYRDAMAIPARLTVCGTSATDFTIADPRDGGMLDVAGFDSNAPKVIADFGAGRI